MKLVRVDEIPKIDTRRPKKYVHELLEQFIRSDMKYAKVEWAESEYSRVENARCVLVLACKRYGYLIDVKVRCGELYLAKKEA